MAELKKYPNLQALNQADRELMELAIKSREQAYAPYSHFRVGASLLLSDGKRVTGNNQENAVYPNGLCAERVALFAAHANHPKKTIKVVAISCRNETRLTNQPYTSCGSCRQAMLEYELLQADCFRILFYGEEGEVWEAPSAQSLLPHFFDASALR